MKNEKPILFSSLMVRAILEGRKTQTRRMIKSQPEVLKGDPSYLSKNAQGILKTRCHFGQAGTKLWVRETCLIWKNGANGASDVVYVDDPEYDACKEDGKELAKQGLPDGVCGRWCVTPSIFMPRWASRISLRVVNVRVERLHDISEEDAQAEGISNAAIKSFKNLGVDRPAGYAYRELWMNINGPDLWEVNPFVWVVEFERVI